MRKSLEVFALDEMMNRATGSIPYTSLIWTRRYHECGQFQMTVPANVYDPSWAYVYADLRPETGIIQKVEYSDSSTVAGGVDTVTVSGFFLECILNRVTFLVEQPEEQTIEIKVPEPKKPGLTKAQIPQNIYWDPQSDGYFYQNSSGDLIDKDGNKVDGESSWVHLEVQIQASNRVDEGPVVQPSDTYTSNYYWVEADDPHNVHLKNCGSGLVSVYPIEIRDDKGNVFYHSSKQDVDKIYVSSPSISRGALEGYQDSMRAWNASGGVRYETITVKGPWQRTDTMEPITESDSVDQLFRWLQRFFGTTFKYKEPEIEGVVKTLDPSLRYFGDFAYSVLREVEASLRVVYGFENNSLVFEVYRGLDRTQDNGGQTPVETSAPVLMSAAALSSAPVLPDGYTELDYIQSSGTQYIDTGLKPQGSSRCVVDVDLIEATDYMGVFGGRTSARKASFILWQMAGGLRYDYSGENLEITRSNSGRMTIDANGGQFYIDGSLAASTGNSTFSSTGNLILFSAATGDGADSVDERMARGKLYSCQIYDNGAQVRGFVPAKRDSDGAVGLYDTVGQSFYANAGTGTFEAGPVVQYADSLTYMPNGGEGSMDPTPGYVGDAVVVEANGFTRDGYTFRTWNTQADGAGTDYAPLSEYTLTAEADVLYAQWDEEPQPGGPAPWAVFSDTWGTISGYSASRDDSNYKNTCYVLYSYDEPSEWNDDGTPALVEDYGEPDETTGQRALEGWHVPYTTKRGYQTARVGDGVEADSECYLDLRDEGDGVPSCDSQWSRDQYRYDEGQPNHGKPTFEPMRDLYEQWPDALTQRGVVELEQHHGVVTNLDTGTVVTSGYMRDWDLGDKVDFGVSTVGLADVARITEVEEVYESTGTGVRNEIHITVGERLLTTYDKLRGEK